MYSQPFFVGINNERFPHRSSDGYLLALEPREPEIDEEAPEPKVKYKSIYFKMDRGAFELNRRVNELENANKYLLETIKEMRANASKRKTNRYNTYST